MVVLPRRVRSLRHVAVAVALACLLATPLAAAAGGPVDAVLAIDGPIRFDGTLVASATDATLVVAPPASGEALVLSGADGALRVVTVRREAVANPLVGDHWLPPQEEVETIALTGARLVLRDARDGFLAALSPLGQGTLGVRLPDAPRLLGATEGLDLTIGTDAGYAYYFHREVPAGAHVLDGVGASMGVDHLGPFQAALTGATLEVEAPDGLRVLELGTTEETLPGAPGGTVYRQTTTFAVAALDAAAIALAPDALGTWYSAAPTLEVDGRVLLQRARGEVAIGGVATPVLREGVDLVGRFTLTAVPSGDGKAFRVEGQAQQVLVGGRPYAAPLDLAQAAPAAALLALVLAYATGLGPKALAAAAVPLYAAATPQAVLANERRRAIYQAVLRQPGIHMRELHRATNLRWGSLQYHTALLLGTGLLVASRAGRRTVLACDAHRLTPEQIRALHLLRSPRASGVARAVARSVGATQRSIAEGTGVSFRLVSRYLAMMTDLGLVEVVGEGRPKMYAATPRLAELLPHAAQPPRPAMPGAPSPPLDQAMPPA
jgi:DNA-binding transcriptional ArsR family regulator